EDRKGSRHHGRDITARHRRRGDRMIATMRRRTFITLLGGAAAAWPLAARAQQPGERIRRIGVLMPFSADDPVVEARKRVLEQALAQLGWKLGTNLALEYRLPGGGAESVRRQASELVALAPDVIVTAGSLAPSPVLEATRTIPVVMTNVPDPVGADWVQSLARPGGNATGFTNFEGDVTAADPLVSEHFRCCPRTCRPLRDTLSARRGLRWHKAGCDMRRRDFITLLGGAAAAAMPPLVAAAQDYPNRAITLIVNFPPGGSTDAMARIIREPLSQALGQNIIIDNRGGAGGTTGAAAVANAKPDGYTLLLSVNSALTTNRYLQKNFPFDPKTAFAPITL